MVNKKKKKSANILQVEQIFKYNKNHINNKEN